MRSAKRPEATSTRPLVNWEAVRVLAVAVGVREAARRLGISQEATMKRSQREAWLRDPEARAANARLNSQRQSDAASQRLTMSATCPRMSPAAAMAGELAQLNGKTRLCHARAQAKVAEHVAERSGAENLDDAQKIKAAAQTANLIHGWQDQPPTVRVRLDVLCGSADATPIDIEAETAGADNWGETDPLDDY
jgi:hypothetical protein